MRRPSRPARTLAAGAGLVLAAGLLGSCSAEEPAGTDLVAQAQEVQYRNDLAEQQEIARRAATLPTSPAGTVTIDGETEGSLTTELTSELVRSGTGTTVDVGHGGEDQAFGRLCAGEIDVVDSVREISRAEWDACRAVGLDVVQFQLAADAVVVAIKSETDVGGDCLSTQQIQDIYRAGSPVTSWDQLGLDAVPLSVAGPDLDNDAFTFFGQVVLDAPEPSLVNLRSDYEARDTDQQSRTFVVGSPRDRELAGLNADRQRVREDLRSQLTARWQVVQDALEEVRTAQAEVEKGVRDQRPASTRARDRQRLVAARAAWRQARAEKDQVLAQWQAAKTEAEGTAAAAQRYAATVGHVSYFRFSYYELFEDQLRPFEVTLPDGERNCVFPSQRTIVSGQYPLARRLLLTTTTRSLERRDVAGLLEFYLQHAVESAEDQRLVALPDAQVAQQLAVVRGEAEPVLVAPDAPVEASEANVPTDEPAR